MIVSVANNKKASNYTNIKIIEELVNQSIDCYLEKSGNNCLSDIILPGSKIVIKPNFVMDKNGNHGIKGNPMDCFITSWEIIFAFIKRLNEIRNLNIIIAECPMQWCDINRIVTPEIRMRLKTVYKYSPIEFKDLRAFQYIKGTSEELKMVKKRNDFKSTDVKLDAISAFSTMDDFCDRLRIMDYPLEGLRKYHSRNSHIYNFDNTFLECDYIVSMPKLKTHMKAGMTGTMKNFVGTISDKRCIPHHTKGAAVFGKGDCYEKWALDKMIGEQLYDYAYGFISSNPQKYEFVRRIINRCILGIRKKFNLNDNISGSWYGNKTLPKSIIDINRAIAYGGIDGKLHDSPQRKIFTLMDCVVVGEGNGPLSPQPNIMGTVIFSDSCYGSDVVAASLIGFDFKKIHYLSDEKKIRGKYELYDGKWNVFINGQEVKNVDHLTKFKIIDALPPKNWKGNIEYNEN